MLTEEFSERGAGFVQKITGKVDRPLQKVREFRNRPQEPAIAVTVDLLSTGVDIPTIEAILFIRPVKSRILFEQMMGRGTRLAKDIGKTHFTVYDAIGVVNYFKNAHGFSDPAPSKPTKSYAQLIDEIYNNKNEVNISILTRRLQRVAKNISAEDRQKLEPFIKHGDIGQFAANLRNNLETNWKETIDILRNRAFQYILDNYKPVKNDFINAINQQDTVISEHFAIIVQGKEYKPADYLELFREFVRRESNKIAALEILLNRPEELNTDLLDELRENLAKRPEQFTESHLRRAYENNLADIIGMRRSALSDEPLLTTAQRMDRAIRAVTNSKVITPAQKQWFDLIANHLEFNLLLEKRHFASIPFSNRGGWKKADQDFNNELEIIVAEINEAMTK